MHSGNLLFFALFASNKIFKVIYKMEHLAPGPKYHISDICVTPQVQSSNNFSHIWEFPLPRGQSAVAEFFKSFCERVFNLRTCDLRLTLDLRP